MAYNSRHKKKTRPVVINDNEDDYIYPTKKSREQKTRNRKHDKNLIKAGLADYERHKKDSFEDTFDMITSILTTAIQKSSKS